MAWSALLCNAVIVKAQLWAWPINPGWGCAIQAPSARRVCERLVPNSNKILKYPQLGPPICVSILELEFLRELQCKRWLWLTPWPADPKHCTDQRCHHMQACINRPCPKGDCHGQHRNESPSLHFPVNRVVSQSLDYLVYSYLQRTASPYLGTLSRVRQGCICSTTVSRKVPLPQKLWSITPKWSDSK